MTRLTYEKMQSTSKKLKTNETEQMYNNRLTMEENEKESRRIITATNKVIQYKLIFLMLSHYVNVHVYMFV